MHFLLLIPLALAAFSLSPSAVFSRILAHIPACQTCDVLTSFPPIHTGIDWERILTQLLVRAICEESISYSGQRERNSYEPPEFECMLSFQAIVASQNNAVSSLDDCSAATIRIQFRSLRHGAPSCPKGKELWPQWPAMKGGKLPPSYPVNRRCCTRINCSQRGELTLDFGRHV